MGPRGRNLEHDLERGPGFEDAFTDAYGVARDEPRVQFYRLLYCLVS